MSLPESPPSPIAVIIDGNYFAHRFYYGRSALSGHDGSDVGMLLAYAQWLLELRADARLSHLVLVLDHPGPSFRHQLYPAYKAQRPPSPAPLQTQLACLPALAVALGVPVLQRPGVEADDVIASLCRALTRQPGQIWLATSDKDLDQLLSPQVSTWDPFRDTRRAPADLWQERGITPQQVPDWLCMVGDSADNIPGIRGIGSKGAAQLLGQHGSLAEVLARASSFTPRRQQACAEFMQRQELMQRLVRVVDDLFCDSHGGFTIDWPDVRPAPLDADGAWLDRLAALGLPCARLRQRYLNAEAAPSPTAFTTVEELSIHVHSGWWGVALAADEAAGDGSQILALVGESQGVCQRLLLRLQPDQVAACLAAAQARGAALGVLDAAAWQGDWRAVLVPMLSACCRSGQWLLDPEATRPALPALAPLAAAEAAFADLQRLHAAFRDQGLAAYAQDVHWPQQHLLWRLAATQLPCASPVWALAWQELAEWQGQLRRDLFAIAGRPLDLDQPAQVADFILRRCDILPSTQSSLVVNVDDASLQALRGQHEVVETVLQERQARRLLHDACPASPLPPCRLQRHGLAGELRADNPVWQHWPAADAMGRGLRLAVRCDGGSDRLLSMRCPDADLALLAAHAGDEQLSAQLRAGDPWRAMAAVVLALPPSMVAPRHKRLAQDLHRCLLEQRLLAPLAQRYSLEMNDVESFSIRHRQCYAGLHDWLGRTVRDAAVCGWITLPSGRRLRASRSGEGDFAALLLRRRVLAAWSGAVVDGQLALALAYAERFPETRLLALCPGEWLWQVPTQRIDASITWLQAWMQHWAPHARPQFGSAEDWGQASAAALLRPGLPAAMPPVSGHAPALSLARGQEAASPL